MKILKDIKEKMQTLEIEKNDLQQILIKQGFDATNIPFIEYHAFLNLGQCDYYVSATGNDTNDGLNPNTAFLTLNQAISTATSGQSIGVLAGIYTGTSNCDLVISKSLNIYGMNGTIFDGESTSRSGWTLMGVVNVTGITFKNGKTTANGGAIWNRSPGVISDCTFNNNTATYGGAIYNYSTGALKNNDFLTTTSTNIYCDEATTIDNTYWNTNTPTIASYNSTLNGSIVTNDRTTPNHPERIVS